MESVQGVIEVLHRGIADRVFPGAVALVAQGGKIVFFEHVGYRLLVPERASMTRDTIFDLASLTKVFATVPTIMKLVDQGRIALEDPLSKLINSANLGDKKGLTLQDARILRFIPESLIFLSGQQAFRQYTVKDL